VRADNTVNECPECKHRLYLDINMLVWRCTNPKCKRIYKYEELSGISVTRVNETEEGKDQYRSETGTGNHKPRESDAHNRFEPSHGSSYRHPANREPSEKSHRVPIIIGITLACIVAVIMFIIFVDPFTPTLSANLPSFYFTVYDGLNPPIQTLEVESSGRAITWSATDDAQWLRLDPVDGSTDEDTLITLSVDVSGLYPGEYDSTITIHTTEAKNTIIDILAKLRITETKETLGIKEAVLGTADNLEIYYDIQPPTGDYNLVNNPNATNPTWEELLQFITSDDTDKEPYIEDIYMCGDFAETLHNNAEQEGIRAAWVGIHFADDIIGHALNAFNTIDEGVVFVDCTGGGFDVVAPSFGDIQIHESDYDRIAYIEIGEDYGAVALEIAEWPQYTFYEHYEYQWERYKKRVERFNIRAEEYGVRVEEFGRRVDEYGRAISSGTYDYATLQMMSLDLEREAEELERETEYLNEEADYLNQLIQDLGYYPLESLGVVSDIKILW